MKLAFVAQPFDLVPGGGSVAIWIQELASRLVERHEVAVYSPAHEGRPNEELLDGVRHVRISTAADEVAARLLRAVGRRLGREQDFYYRHYYFGRLYYRAYLRRLAARIRRDGADAILVSNFSQFVPQLRRSNASSRIVLMMHCDWLVELDRRRVERWLRGVDAVCGCSDYIRAGVVRRFPPLAPRCHAVQNGSNPERFAETASVRERTEALRAELGLQGRTVLVFVGRVCPEKGVHVLVEAMERVVRERPDVSLLVVGGLSQQPPSPRWVQRRDARFGAFEALKPRYEAHLQHLARGLGDRVRFVGRVPHQDLAAYYGLADVFVHPAVWQEPFGMILTEAMACGLPVVATRAGGIPEIVDDGRTGLLVRPGDPENLAGALLELAADPQRRIEMGRRGLERQRARFTWEHTARRMERVLLDLAAE